LRIAHDKIDDLVAIYVRGGNGQRRLRVDNGRLKCAIAVAGQKNDSAARVALSVCESCREVDCAIAVYNSFQSSRAATILRHL
jgi:hypothetical protein